MSETAGKESKSGSKELAAVILVRGLTGIRKDIRETLEMMRLLRKNCCVVLEKTPQNTGMIKKVKDYITWGDLNEETLKLLIDKRGEKSPKDGKKTKPFFRLHPPRGGFERKGIKAPFSRGGVLGYRGDRINDLVKRMI